jgi:beta-glucosidase
MAWVWFSYILGSWPPGVQNPNQATRASAAIARAHIEAVRKFRKHDLREIKTSVAMAWTIFDPKPGWPNELVANFTNWGFNHMLVEALMTGKINVYYPGGDWIQETVPLPEGRPTLDYLGINYYSRSLVSTALTPPFIALESGPGPKTDLGWEIYPEGIFRAVMDAHQSFKLPILISENGVADRSDAVRAQFMESHLLQLLRAKAKGAQVLGYLHWSLTDNFEWSHGLAPRFGLVEVDYTTLKLTPRPSYAHFGQLVRSFTPLFAATGVPRPGMSAALPSH